MRFFGFKEFKNRGELFLFRGFLEAKRSQLKTCAHSFPSPSRTLLNVAALSRVGKKCDLFGSRSAAIDRLKCNVAVHHPL
jgi:hypothetical protein